MDGPSVADGSEAGGLVMSSGGVKLSKTEAANLAAFLLRVGRPQDDHDKTLMVHWARRLEGGRS